MQKYRPNLESLERRDVPAVLGPVENGVLAIHAGDAGEMIHVSEQGDSLWIAHGEFGKASKLDVVSLAGIHTVVVHGGAGNDFLIGAARTVQTDLYGHGGNDFLSLNYVAGGTLDGGAGNDVLVDFSRQGGRLIGGLGTDVYIGGFFAHTEFADAEDGEWVISPWTI